MASENNIEHLDDYLSNRLSQGEREEFEAKMEADPNLKQEFEFQQNLIESIRSKRIAELKTMLNNTPVSFFHSEQGALVTKIAASVLVAGITISGIYYYLSNDVTETSQEAPIEQIVPAEDQDTTNALESESAAVPSNPEPKTSVSPKSNEGDAGTLKRERELVKIIASTFVTSNTEVVTESNKTNFNFHYAFQNKKLVLYGTFESNQYQILEFITKEEHIFFLNYKTKYYLLDERKDEPSPLLPIKDGELLQKLRQFRTR